MLFQNFKPDQWSLIVCDNEIFRVLGSAVLRDPLWVCAPVMLLFSLLIGTGILCFYYYSYIYIFFEFSDIFI